MERAILHSDLNAFYASVEMALDPTLRGRAVAVCGSTEERHGIVLAKSQRAKLAGVQTGMANWQARQLCPELILLPPQFSAYLDYSAKTRAIYQRYTDQVEPYGMDEAWLDVTASRRLFGSAKDIAEEIRGTVCAELGLTVSVGVSFNKVFAKLGSDLNKPDAVTVIAQEGFEGIVWPLPVSELLYVGRSTERRLAGYGIHTIGQLAQAEPQFLQRLFGINGLALWRDANGLDFSPVAKKDFVSPVKSVGHGVTCTADLLTEDEVWPILLYLSQDVGHRLRRHGLAASGVQLTVKDSQLHSRQYQGPLPLCTQSPLELAQAARLLFASYRWTLPVRALTVRAIQLVPEDAPRQMNFFVRPEAAARREQLDETVEAIRSRFGKQAILPAALLRVPKLPGNGHHEVILPGRHE